jgi:hypothetical protein
MLNSDKLGKKGESRFDEICADVGLDCNKSQYDRTGWDFIVEFPFGEIVDNQPSLDIRRAPLSCHVQVKTLWSKNDKITLRLSAAERLAKELKPSFIYVLKVDDALNFSYAYAIHVLNEPLAKILRRLRKEHAAGTTAPNRRTISFSASRDGFLVRPTGVAFRDFALSVCGPDLRSYSVRKSEQLERLGFEERPFKIKMKIAADGIGDLVDIFLGLKKNASASEIEASVTRFGVALPEPGHSEEDALISIEPSSFDTCNIIVRRDFFAQPCIFKAEVFLPPLPNLPAEHFKVLIKSEFLSLLFAKNSWSIQAHAIDTPQAPSAWASYWRLAHALSSGTGTIEITADAHPINRTLDITDKADGPSPSQCAFMVAMWDKVISIFKFAGISDDCLVSHSVIDGNLQKIDFVYQLINSQSISTRASFTTELREVLPNNLALDMLYIDYIELGGITLAYFGVASVIGTVGDVEIVWQAKTLSLKKIAQIRLGRVQYDQMAEAAAKEMGCVNIWKQEFIPSFLPEN